MVLGVGAVAAGVRVTASPGGIDPTIHELGVVAELARQLRTQGWVEVSLAGEPARLAVVSWDPQRGHRDGTAREVYGPDAPTPPGGQPITTQGVGLMVLMLQSPHSGCRVFRCESSGWFEDPCHGGRWNTWGEWAGGPDERGLGHVAAWIEDGYLKANTSSVTQGTARGQGVLDEDPGDELCVAE